MALKIPYTEVGIGIAVILGVWAFLIAETVKERTLIAGIPAVIFAIGAAFPSPAVRLIVLIGWMLYGLGCIIYLRYNGLEIR